MAASGVVAALMPRPGVIGRVLEQKSRWMGVRRKAWGSPHCSLPQRVTREETAAEPIWGGASHTSSCIAQPLRPAAEHCVIFQGPGLGQRVLQAFQGQLQEAF